VEIYDEKWPRNRCFCGVAVLPGFGTPQVAHKTWFSGTGIIHSEELHLVEKFTRLDENTIVYKDTVEDPVVLTGPWTRRSTIMLRPGTRIREYECVENNQDIQRYEEL
jgi:hypothetical protein